MEQFPMLGTPVTWVVDANGVARTETWGFSGDGEKWTDQVVRTIEKLKSAASDQHGVVEMQMTARR